MQLEIVQKCRGYFPHLYDDGLLWASRGNYLLTTPDLGRTWCRVAEIYSDSRRILTRCRLIDRFLDHGMSNAVRLQTGEIFAVTGTRQRWLPRGESRFREISSSPIDFRPIRRNVCVDRDGSLLVADYRSNHGEDPGEKQRDAVEIHRCTNLADGTWDVAYRFDAGRIRHIHAVILDPITSGRTWVLTGDTNAESAIYCSDDGLRSLQVFAADGQRTRAVDLILTDDHVIWGIDSPKEDAGIVRKARDGGPIEWLCNTPCPVYFATTNEAGQMFFSTTVEPGPSVKSNRTEIFASSNGLEFRAVFSRAADPIPQVTQIHFPHGVLPENYLVFYCRATLGWDNDMAVARLRA